MLIKIIHVDVESKSAKNGKTYEQAEVIYEANGKKGTKKLMSFSNPSVFKTVKDASKGDSYEVELVKDGDYWQWTKIVPAGNYTDGGDAPAAPQRSTSTTAPVNRSFETKEERDARQRLIVRQSSLTAALATLSPGAKGPLDPNVVKAMADDYTDWVFEKLDLFDTPDDLPE